MTYNRMDKRSFRLTVYILLIASTLSAGALLVWLLASGGAAAVCVLLALLLTAGLAAAISLLFAAKRNVHETIRALTPNGKVSGDWFFRPHSAAEHTACAGVIRADIMSVNEQEYQKKLMDKQMSLTALQNQINPHFLYNTLDCIRGEALLRDQDEIAEIISDLSSFFRYSISRKGNIVSVREELQNVRNYYKIQRFRFTELAELEISCPDDAALDTLIPKLTLQPLVENAISHGLSGKIDGGSIRLTLMTTGQDLIIHCIDNGVGIPAEKLNSLTEFISDPATAGDGTEYIRGTGIGLRNVNRRIELLFGRPYGITLYSTPGSGTDVEVRIPLKASLDDGEEK